MPASEAAYRPLYLIGMMGTGKSTVGPLLALRMGCPFVDLDTVVEQEAQATVAEIFAAEGEAGFRRRETEALRHVSTRGRQIVAAGGGAPMAPGNLELMSTTGLVVCLTATVETLLGRIGDAQNRPLLMRRGDVEAELKRLGQARQAVYARAHLSVDTTGLSPSQVAARIVEAAARWAAP